MVYNSEEVKDPTFIILEDDVLSKIVFKKSDGSTLVVPLADLGDIEAVKTALSGIYVGIAGDETITGLKTLSRTAPDAGQTVTTKFTAVPGTGGIQGVKFDRTNQNRPLGFEWTLNGVTEGALGIDAGTNDMILFWSNTAPGDQIRVREGPHLLMSRSVGHPDNAYRFRIDAVDLDPVAMVDLLYLTGPVAGPATRLLRVSNATDNLFVVEATGDIGIGTLTPAQLIQAVKSQAATTQFLLQNLLNNAASKVSFRLQSDAKSLFMESFATTFAAPLGGHSMVYTSAGSDLALGAGNSERMRIMSTGVVGIGTTGPNANAILDLVSTTKAFMPPRMTTAQRDAIPSPTAGMEIYNTSTNKKNIFTTIWEQVTSA